MFVGCSVWGGALIGSQTDAVFAVLIMCVGAAAALVMRNRVAPLIVFAGVGMLSGAQAADRAATTFAADLPAGRGVFIGTTLTDPLPYGDHLRFLFRPERVQREQASIPWQGPPVAVVTEVAEVTAGDRVVVAGRMRAQAEVIRGDPVAGRILAAEVVIAGSSSSWTFGAGNAVRDRVRSRLVTLGSTPEAALLSGFLIGDIAALPRSDTESLRRSGLTHYVAVSGSNVALVLGAWWLVLGPLGAGNRVRAATGVIVLAVFVVATRWESSVIRAATMAAIVMGGRAVGVAVDAWGALGAAVTVLVAVSGDLAFDVGFQLSVVATSGVLLGMNYWSGRSPRIFWSLLAATISAQLAVVPLLLLHFGTIPLLSPVANLLAAPLVTVGTASAGIGVILGLDPPLYVADQVAGMVLSLARTAGQWPQLNAAMTIGLAALLITVWRTRLRWSVVTAVLAVSVVTMVPRGAPGVPTIVFLDVGQGDAVLLLDPSGAVALIDGGRDSMNLLPGLRRYGVTRIDLLVASHGDADHVGGFVDVVDRVEIGRLWVPEFAELGDLLEDVVQTVEAKGAAVEDVMEGFSAQLGEFSIRAISPTRRYAADNDGSIVLLVTVAGREVLLPGDIGEIAQHDLRGISVDLLMVPHHGAATSDPEWVTSLGASTAVISVGPNTYGHPSAEVLDPLIDAGTSVLTTWEQGDIVVEVQ